MTLHGKVRSSLLNQIMQIFEGDAFFTPEDFVFSSATPGPEKGDEIGAVLVIEYIADPDNYYITVDIPHSRRTVPGIGPTFAFAGIQGPGEIHVTEHYVAYGVDGLLERVQAWLACLKEDVKCAPVMRLIASHQRQIDEILASVGDLTNDYFSAEEGELMRERLEDLEVRVRDAAESGAQTDEALRTRIDAMASTLAMLKMQVSVLSKKSWWHLAASRIASWVSEPAHQHLLRSGVDLAKELVTGKPETLRLGNK